MQFTKLLSVISDELAIGYALTALPLFACYFLLRKRRGQLRQLVLISNVLLLLSAFVYILHYFLTRQVAANELREEWEVYADVNRYFGPYWFSYWGGILSRGILPLLLLIPKIRSSVWGLPGFGLVVVLPFFTIYLYSLFSIGDYLAVSISWEFDALELIKGLMLVVVIYAILLFIIYFAKYFFEKRKLQ